MNAKGYSGCSRRNEGFYPCHRPRAACAEDIEDNVFGAEVAGEDEREGDFDHGG